MYCKFILLKIATKITVVLIVAKCIVNNVYSFGNLFSAFVLIVAKCIVNSELAPVIFSVYTY